MINISNIKEKYFIDWRKIKLKNKNVFTLKYFKCLGILKLLSAVCYVGIVNNNISL